MGQKYLSLSSFYSERAKRPKYEVQFDQSILKWSRISFRIVWKCILNTEHARAMMINEETLWRGSPISVSKSYYKLKLHRRISYIYSSYTYCVHSVSCNKNSSWLIGLFSVAKICTEQKHEREFKIDWNSEYFIR